MVEIVIGFIKALILDSLFIIGVSGFFACWWLNFTKRLIAVVAIPAASVSLAFAAYVYSGEEATKKAEIQCKILQSEAKAEGERAAKESLQTILDEQRRRLFIAEGAAERSKELAKRYRDELQNAEQERDQREVKIDELEKSLPDNPDCTTSSALRGELSD